MKNHSNTNPVRFAAIFIALFLTFYYFNIGFFGITSPGNHYSAFLDKHLNYIELLRRLLIGTSTRIINAFGYTAIHNGTEILVAGHGIVQVVYTCLGLGVLSFFSAFVIAYPKPLKQKLMFLMAGVIAIEFLNLIRFVVLAIFLGKYKNRIIDHHIIFNIFIYTVIVISLYFWVTNNKNRNVAN